MTTAHDMQNSEQDEELFPFFVRRGNPYVFSAGFINKQGDVVIPATFQDAGRFQEHCAPVRIQQLWGVVDGAGELIIPCQWRFPTRFINGFALIRELKSGRERSGFLRRDGHWIVRAKYVLATAFSCGLAQVFDGLHHGFINEEGVETIPLVFDDSRPFRHGLAPVKQGSRWGYINTSGNFVIQPKFDFALPFSEGLARVQNCDKWGLINEAGEWIIEPKFDLLWDMHCGRCAATVAESVGFINSGGQWIVKPTYTHVSNYQDDLAWVKSIGQKTKICIDRFGQQVFPGEFLEADTFYHGLSLVGTESKIGYLDKAGSLIWQGQYVERSLNL